MIRIADFSRMLGMENQILHQQTQDLSQVDTLIQPPSGGNCMNWVLGHTLENQITILQLLDGESPIQPVDLARYQRESEPIRADAPGIWTLERLLEGHDMVLAVIVARLSEMSEEDFEQEIQVGERKVIRGWRVFFYFFHFTYHIGQLEYLRNLAGKTEKVI